MLLLSLVAPLYHCSNYLVLYFKSNIIRQRHVCVYYLPYYQPSVQHIEYASHLCEKKSPTGVLPVAQQESSSQHTLLIIDDHLDKEDTSLVQDILIKGSHHNNISVTFDTQNLFLPHKVYRTLSLNTHYIVIFKNPRDMSQIYALAQQAFASKPTFLTTVCNQEISDRHSYLLMDFKQCTPNFLRVRDSITTPEKTTVFIPTLS